MFLTCPLGFCQGLTYDHSGGHSVLPNCGNFYVYTVVESPVRVIFISINKEAPLLPKALLKNIN